MVTLAGDACGVKKHKQTYGESTPEKIVGDRLLRKTPYYDKAGQVSEFFLGEFLPFC
jgi:hypothetical protein